MLLAGLSAESVYRHVLENTPVEVTGEAAQLLIHAM